jgi:putative flavoprotein involved in K+ transport
LLVDAAPAIGHVWRSRRDSLRLFTPAEYDALPGLAFPAPAGTYPNKDEVADYLKQYVERFDLPVRLNTRVTRLTKDVNGFIAGTTTGTVTAAQVVVATGPFQRPIVPAVAADLGPRSYSCTAPATETPANCLQGRYLSWEQATRECGLNSGLTS